MKKHLPEQYLNPTSIDKMTEKPLSQALGIVIGVCVMLGLFCSIACATESSSKIVRIAQSQIGLGEQGGDNRGAIVRKYTGGQEVAWCASFVSWVLRQSGHSLPYYLSARSYLNLNSVRSPKPGDIIVLSRAGRNTGHVGIVEKVDGKHITTIEGNVGSYPARIKRVTYTLGNIKNLLGFVRPGVK